MPRQFIDKEKLLIMICGLPGTGKTTIARKLANAFKGQYLLIEQNAIRRQLGLRKMPKTQEITLRTIDRMTARQLLAGKGVIFESVNRHSFRRHQMYGVASGCGKRVITLEVVCGEATAKQRMLARPKSDGLLSDPTDPTIYDRLKTLWEDVTLDFKFPGQDHVAYLQFNSETKILNKIIPRPGMGKMIRFIRMILSEVLV